jgi:hypothetical protein
VVKRVVLQLEANVEEIVQHREMEAAFEDEAG